MKIIKNISQTKIAKYRNGTAVLVSDHIVVEEPLEIRLCYGPPKNRHTESIYVTMRTPGHDEYLALGFLFTEDIISSKGEVYKIAHLNEHVVLIELIPGIPFDKKLNQRNFLSNSSCGICGKTTISSVCNHRYEDMKHTNILSTKTILGLSDNIKKHHTIFNLTGGLHSAALFDFEGNLIAIKEDVGRHNALDKLVGFIIENELDHKSEMFILLSGRIGFELIHKTLKIGISILVAVGSPSSLSIKIAEKYNLCVVGFLKTNSFNVYTHKDRIETKQSM